VIEDKLTHDERLRLECIAQAAVSTGAAAGRPVSAEQVIETACRFERFIAEPGPEAPHRRRPAPGLPGGGELL
jgi:hypothetical protein